MGYVVTDKYPGGMGIVEGGVLKRIKGMGIVESAVLRKVGRIWIKTVAGAGTFGWKSFAFQPPTKLVTISGTQTQLDIFTAIGSPTTSVKVEIRISPGTTMYSTTKNTPTIYFSSLLPTGSFTTIDNQANVYGSNGSGGDGNREGRYGSRMNGYSGGSGGKCISLGSNTTIANGAGLIAGGGGGGGGGANVFVINDPGTIAAGGGGAGNPKGESNGGGNDGQTAVYGVGTGGAGIHEDADYEGWSGKGGDCAPGVDGEDGGDSLSENGGPSSGWAGYGGSGGSAGAAVDKNGFTLVFTSGGTAPNVLGDIIP
jgi:hypothetical protein